VADFYLNAGDTASPIFETLEDENGFPVDIQGATIKLTVTPLHGGTPTINAKTALNQQNGDGSDGTKGEVAYGEGAAPYAAGETTIAGDYLYAWTVTFAGGAIQTYPNAGYRLLTITPDAPTTVGHYVTREELKKTLQLTGETYADNDLDIAISAASRGLESAFDTIWTLRPPGEVRYYTAYTSIDLLLGDVMVITSIGVEYSGFPGSGQYATALSASDYRLYPLINGLISGGGVGGTGGNGEPYRKLRLARGASQLYLPTDPDAIKITGQFGWQTIPAGVQLATTIIATRMLRRARENPTGFATLGVDGAALIAQGFARDPEIQYAMQYASPPKGLFV
jgi:hypothetical protein